MEKHRDDFTVFSGLHHPNGLGQAHVCADTWLTGGGGTGADPRLDPSGELPDGRKFPDAAALKRLMFAGADTFASTFSEKLATYAL